MTNPVTGGRPWRLTRQAEARLAEIARWTVRTFGPRQAEAYERDLVARCDGIAAETVPSRSCRDVFDPALDARLRFTRCGSHFIVFIVQPDSVIIIDIIHMRSDVPRRVADAPDD